MSPPVEVMSLMWIQGCDTLDIAKSFGVPESYVYNRIDLIKGIAHRIRREVRKEGEA